MPNDALFACSFLLPLLFYPELVEGKERAGERLSSPSPSTSPFPRGSTVCLGVHVPPRSKGRLGGDCQVIFSRDFGI